MMKFKLLFLTCLIFQSTDILDTGTNIRFQRITINEGLSLSSVYCIFQDSKGFMWFGTEDGLNRFDGKNFRIFRPVPGNSNSISYRWIEHILEDKNGILWFGSRGGLTRFDPRLETFTRYIHNEADTTTISNDTITKIFLDNRNQLWIGTRSGLNRINLPGKDIQRIHLFDNGMIGLNEIINDISQDQQDNLWIATDNGLFLYDQESRDFSCISLKTGAGKIIRFLSIASDHDELWIGTENGLFRYSILHKDYTHIYVQGFRPSAEVNQQVEKVYIDNSGFVWIITEHGLYKFDTTTNSLIHIVPSFDTSHSLSIITVKPLLEDSNGYLWFGTFGSGLYKIEPGSGNISQYQHNPADPKSLSENAINCIYEDRAGRLWFGTFGAGISIYDPQSNKFELLRHNPLDPNSLSSDFIWSIWEDRNGDLWIGTNDRGLNHYSVQTMRFSFYDRRDSDPNSLSNSSVRKIFEDSKGNIWIGTDGGGLDKLDRNSGKFTHFRSVYNNPQTISNNSVRAIYEDNTGTLWIGTRNGLNHFNPETGQFKRYMYDENNPLSISNNFVYSSIYQDKHGFLWIATYGGGLNKMDIENESFTHYLFDPEDPEGISDNVVFSFYEDPGGLLWIGTNSGLNRFDPITEKFKRFGLDEGLPSEVIYGVIPDETNNIWLSTNLGISRFNILDYSVQNFDVNDGLQSNEFNGGAFHKGSSGKVYFGGVYGLNIIDPQTIKPAQNVSMVVISKLEILGKEVGVLPQTGKTENRIMDIDGNLFLPENISFIEKIILDYKYWFFSIEFSAMNNPLPEKVEYAYIMENLDQEWNYPGNRNYVSYANMRSGTYNFRVKTKNPDGIWSDSSASLAITILPPVWETWWFILLEILIALILAIFIYRYLVKARTNKLLTIQNEKINKANALLAESENNLREINATKDKFFSIIAHDLRNPLTSLLSISESMIQGTKYPEADEEESGIQKIHESIRQIHDLLENLLTWSRSQTGRLKFEPVNFNMSRLVEINMNLHRVMAESKSITLACLHKEDITAFGDRDMVNTIVRNLLNNAVKFTPEGGRIETDIRQDGDFLQVIVKDSGVGISEENMHKLFRIDVKYKTPGTLGEKGTGLGLILCKEFVEKNGGKMIVESEPGKGSVFGFTIPQGQ